MIRLKLGLVGLFIGFLIVLYAAVGGFAGVRTAPPAGVDYVSAAIAAGSHARRYYLADFNKLKMGMTYVQATAVIGSGRRISQVVRGGMVIETYSWSHRDGTGCNAQFQNDALVTKAQVGLK